jgi:hypothetical protein
MTVIISRVCTILRLFITYYFICSLDFVYVSDLKSSTAVLFVYSESVYRNVITVFCSELSIARPMAQPNFIAG